MLEKFRSIIGNYVDIKPEDITLETNIKNELGLTSLELVNLVVEMENTFHIEIPDEEIMKIETIQDAIKIIEKHQK